MKCRLMARGAVERAEHPRPPAPCAARGRSSPSSIPPLRAAMSHDADDAAMIERSGLHSTMALPLDIGEGTLGALGVGVGRSGRRYGVDELAFAELLAGRAALALANAQLVARLTATQRRLDGILETLAEAVTVHDAPRQGRVHQSGRRAAARPTRRPLRARCRAERAARHSSRCATRRDETVYPEELPGARVIRGERPEPLLTRSIVRATGESRWFLTKATALRDETGATLAVNVIEDLHRGARGVRVALRGGPHAAGAAAARRAARGARLGARRPYRPGERGPVGGDFYDVVPGRGRPLGAAGRRDRQGRRGGGADLARPPLGPHRRALRPPARRGARAWSTSAERAAAAGAGHARVRASSARARAVGGRPSAAAAHRGARCRTSSATAACCSAPSARRVARGRRRASRRATRCSSTPTA